jgi:hypothetical protein
MQLTNHIIKQASLKGISLAAIETVLKAPSVIYPSFRKDATGKRVAPMCDKHNVQQEKWTGEAFGEKVCVVVYPCCQKAITVWKDQVETEIRPDQRQQGVNGYKGRDGKWRS